ncbi:MAG TPA: GNAT family N-acetyltransferase [Pirellulales bacterium]
MTSSICAVPARDLSGDQTGAWSRILSECGLLQSPYLRPEFVQALAAVRNDIEVAVVEHNGEPAAFLPFRRMPWNGARPAGGWLANFQALIARPEAEIDPLSIVRACGLRSWQFDHLLRPHAGLEPYVWRAWESPYADLSDGFEGYCRRLRVERKRLTELERQQRKMSRDLGEVRFESHVDSRKILYKLFEWKGAQYDRTRERNIFASPWVCELLDLLLEYQTDEFASLLSVLYAGNRIAAIAYTLRSGPNLHGWFTAFDRELYSYSPGMQLLMELFKAAEGLGIKRVDLGKGPEGYKRRFMTDATHVYEGTVDSNSLVANIRQSWWHTKDWVRESRLASTARASARLVRGVQGWLEMG